ncbi:hypothetical protein SK128_007938 [Halocaridina rubra]|uniref:Uncharacterized protein n=1 Tax=Halocaridina rubra TaxID=373956 RepID=A0AAN8X9C6_HALRR
MICWLSLLSQSNTCCHALLSSHVFSFEREGCVTFSVKTKHDGNLCQCRDFLGDFDYTVAKRVTDCLTDIGAAHEFSPDSDTLASASTCQKYVDKTIEGKDLIKCYFKKLGFIIDVDGEDQWDLNSMSSAYINLYTADYPSVEDFWIRTLIINVFLTCHADPTDFEVIPFEDCWERAKYFLDNALKN